jgi:ABC-type nitrate/sulfonate/bicarbonate transport system substrate-binding protein
MKTAWRRAYVILAAGALAFSLTVTGFGSGVPRSEAGLQTVRIGVGPYLDYQPWFLAHKLGFDTQQGLDLNFTTLTAFQTGVADLQRGDLDLLFSCQSCTFSVVKKVPAVRDWMVTDQFKGFLIVGRKGQALTYASLVKKVGPNRAKTEVLKSWKGKTFVLVAANYQHLIEGALKAVGLSLNDVKLVTFADDAKAALAFIQGTGDFYTGALPQEAKLLQDFPNKYVKVGGEEILGPGGLWYSTMISKSSWLASHSQAANSLLAVWYRTMKYLAERPSQSYPTITTLINTASAGRLTTKQVTFLCTVLTDFETLPRARASVFNPRSPIYWRVSGAFYANANASVLPAGFKLSDVEVEQQHFRNFLSHKALVNWVNSPLP